MDFTVATDFCTILAIISGENPSFCMLRTTSTVFSALPSTFLKQIFHIYHFLEEKHFYKKNLVVQDFRKKNSILFTKKIPTILAGIMDKNFARFKISTPVVPAGPHTVIFQNKEESSCPHSYYAKTDKKRIFVNYPLILFDILIPSLIRRRIAVFSVLLTLPFLR